jgi:hypothetical protein
MKFGKMNLHGSSPPCGIQLIIKLSTCISALVSSELGDPMTDAVRPSHVATNYAETKNCDYKFNTTEKVYSV